MRNNSSKNKTASDIELHGKQSIFTHYISRFKSQGSCLSVTPGGNGVDLTKAVNT